MFLGEDAVVCPVIDARCGQVYNALFDVCGKRIKRICDDRAIMTDSLLSELKGIKDKKIILCCDAAESVYQNSRNLSNIVLAPKPLIFQNAVGVGVYADIAARSGNFTDAAGLSPTYLKLPQAQRELKAKQKEV